MGKLFGTDGVRGVANKDLTIELAMQIGLSSAYVLGKSQAKIKVVIGRDTRISGSMLLSAISAGLMSMGADVIDLGIIPTPAVSYLVKKYHAQMGVVISASHNPAEFNGIKLFNNEGFKLPDAVEEEIEGYILNNNLPSKNINVGTYTYESKAINDYLEHLESNASNLNPNLKLVIDCANGAASETAPKLFTNLGFKPIIINQNYDGLNINQKAGSTHLEGLITAVKENHADLGIAFDGDADRCLLVDEKGNEIDGDYIIAICSNYYKKNHTLKNNAVVGTVMSNLGLRKYCEANDISFISEKVGDRYVLENMLANDYIIGGEQSGHIIFKEKANTGDGELTAIEILNIISATNESLMSLSKVMQKYPKVLVNVTVKTGAKDEYQSDPEISSLIEKISHELNNNGRILIRPSGTEPLIRVMIEGMNVEDITKKANQIANLIKTKFGA